jgi:23S rRNA (pseudouridine1915-N3)-methyltransferase
MKIDIIAIGNKMPAWVKEGFCEYAKRMPPELKLNLMEISPDKRKKKAAVAQIAAIPQNNYVVALDIKNQIWSTKELAGQMEKWQTLGRDLSLLIGGPEGLDEACLAKAHAKWSLSKLTFPHMLVRVIVAEQLYRASCVLKGHPYHK